MNDIEKQLQLIKRGFKELIPESELIEKLEKKGQLTIKFGADPSAPDIHLGHTVILNKLRQFQDLGHKVVFIIGDFTAMIGDPSGKSATRKALPKDVVKNNAKTYKSQILKILDSDKSKLQIVENSQWLSKMDLESVMKLMSQYSVARMLERNDFEERYKNQQEISILEFLYPLLQGYDSVHLKADVEVGGTDQKFNMLVGRTLQERNGQEPQVVLTMPLLEGTDGVQKMSKSLNNYIGVTEAPKEIFGKTMSISDTLMLRYYELLTDVSLDEVKAMHPKEAKKRLAGLLVGKFYGEKEAKKAEEEFEAVFKQGGLPEKIGLCKLPMKTINIVELLAETKLASSKAEAKRLIRQGGVSVDNEVIKDDKLEVDLSAEKLLKVGKRKFLRVSH